MQGPTVHVAVGFVAGFFLGGLVSFVVDECYCSETTTARVCKSRPKTSNLLMW